MEIYEVQYPKWHQERVLKMWNLYLNWKSVTIIHKIKITALIKAVLTYANTEVQLCNTYILNKICRLFWKLVYKQLRMFISDKLLKFH